MTPPPPAARPMRACPAPWSAAPLAAPDAMAVETLAAQSALPDGVRARGLAIFLTVFSGAMSLGSLGWGTIATEASTPTALLIAALGLVIAVPLTLWARLSGQGEDHQPAHHWPKPEVDPAQDAATTIWIAYDVPQENRARFHALMQEQRRSRRAHGAYSWVLRRDATDPARHYESWHEASWLSHLRHHGRVTVSEKTLQEQIRALLTTPLQIHHTIATRKG